MKVSKSTSCNMYLNSLFLIMQLIITIGVRNGLVQGLSIAGFQVPDQCASICAPAASLYDSCTAISCLCTPGSDTEIQQCANCAIPIEPTLVGVLEQYREDFNSLCSNLPPLTFPPTTISSTTSLTDSSPTASSTETVTSPATTPQMTETITETIPPPSSTSIEVVPLPTNTGNGAELSVHWQSQIGSMGIAIGIILLLRLL